MRKTRRSWGETSLRSKRFRLVSKQRNTEGRGLSVLTAREMKREPKSERGGKGRGRIVRIHWDFTMNAVHAFQNTKKNYFGFTNGPSKVHFRSTEGQTFYWSTMTVDDSIKCRCANSGITGQVGGFQNPGVCLQAFPSFLPHPLPALFLTPFFARSLTLVPRSFLLNRTETLATQVRERQGERHDMQSMP